MKNKPTQIALAALFFALPSPLLAEFLYDSFLIPSFEGEPDTEFSEWNVFYAPNFGINYPDAAAPNGIYQTASDAGFTPPSGSNPANPLAFWHLDNPTITQTNGGHFIIGPGFLGNIYSFSVPGFYELNDQTPYTLGTVVFQFQTEGTSVDFSSIRLRYHDGMGMQELAPTEYIREYQSGTAAFPGFSNRTAVQWDLTGLGISAYQITYNSPGSSMSFQRAFLDTAATYASVVPESRTWTAQGSQVWSNGANWQQGDSSVQNGNVRFENAGATTIALDSNRTVGEVIFDTAADVTITGSSTLTANTGITTTSAAEGTYTIESGYRLGSFSLFAIDGGRVELNGLVSGAHGLVKSGDGTLVFGNNNTFGTASSGVGVEGGTLRIEGSNTYGGSTTVLWGRLELASDALSGSGALGNSSSTVTVGASSDLFSGITEAAQVVITGNHTMARNMNIELGSFEKRLGGIDTNGEALFSGNIALLGSGANGANLKLFSQNESDIVRLTGSLSGGDTTRSLQINANGEQGTVVFSGANKTYHNATIVSGGTLLLADGTSTTGNGNWTVGADASLVVNGTIAGSGAFSLEGNLSGDGAIQRTVVTAGKFATISPGNSPGTLALNGLDASNGATFVFELGTVQDLINVTGTFTGSILDGDLQFQFVGGPGLQTFTDYTLITFASSSNLNLDDLAMVMSPEFAIHQWTIGADSLSVSFSVVPEPSSWVLLILGGALLLLRRYNFPGWAGPSGTTKTSMKG